MTASRRPSRSRASDPDAARASEPSAFAPSDAAQACRDTACRWLARAPRTIAEVETRLRARGFDDAVVGDTVAFLVARRYVDDEGLARRRAEEMLVHRGYGVLRVQHELTLRGVADTVIERAIAAVLEDHHPTDLARRALARRFRGWSRATAADHARAFRFLVGRGHPEDVATAVIEEEAQRNVEEA